MMVAKVIDRSTELNPIVYNVIHKKTNLKIDCSDVL